MTDIVERLRDHERSELGICMDAADEIERLRAELAAEKAETFRLQCSHSALYNECTALRAENFPLAADQRAAIDQARELLRIVTAERDALRADALRYRWLRDVASGEEWKRIADGYSPAATDVEIDFSMAQRQDAT